MKRVIFTLLICVLVSIYLVAQDNCRADCITSCDDQICSNEGIVDLRAIDMFDGVIIAGNPIDKFSYINGVDGCNSGSAWETIRVDNESFQGIRAVDACSSTQWVALGGGKDVYDYNGTDWIKLPDVPNTLTTMNLNDIGCAGDSLFAVGPGGVFRYNGSSWIDIDPNGKTSNGFQELEVIDENNIWTRSSTSPLEIYHATRDMTTDVWSWNKVDCDFSGVSDLSFSSKIGIITASEPNNSNITKLWINLNTESNDQNWCSISNIPQTKLRSVVAINSNHLIAVDVSGKVYSLELTATMPCAGCTEGYSITDECIISDKSVDFINVSYDMASSIATITGVDFTDGCLTVDEINLSGDCEEITCPLTTPVVEVSNDTGSVCSNGGIDDYMTWESAVLASNDGVILSGTPVIAGTNPPTTVLITGIASSLIGCVAEVESAFAYRYCDADNSGEDSAGDIYEMISQYKLSIYPKPDVENILGGSCTGQVQNNCTTGNILITYDGSSTPPTLMPGDADLEVKWSATISGAPSTCVETGTYTLSCPDECPDVSDVPNYMNAICSGDLETLLQSWQSQVESQNQNVVYSSVDPIPGVAEPDMFTPSGDFEGCGSEDQSTTAYLYCDVNNNDLIDAGDEFTEISSFTLMVFSQIDTNGLQNDGTCNVSFVPFCPASYTIENDYDSGMGMPDLSNETGTGTITFTITNQNTPIGCTTATVTASFDCTVTPVCTAITNVQNITEEICSGSIGTLISSWTQDVQNANAQSDILFSSIAPIAGSVIPDNFIPNGIHSLVDICVSENQSSTAYQYCDQNQNSQIDVGDTYIPISSISIEVFAPIEISNSIQNNSTCELFLQPFCSNYTVTNDFDDNEATPDLSNTTGSGSITFSISNSGSPDGCNSMDVVGTYVCDVTPECENLSDYVPPSIEVINSTCNNETGIPEGGLLIYPSNPCPLGYLPAYQLSTGDIIPDTIAYNQTASFCIEIFCFCELNPNVQTQTSEVSCTDPATCPGELTEFSPCQPNVCYSDVNTVSYPANSCISPYLSQIPECNLKIPIKFHYWEGDDENNIPDLNRINFELGGLNSFFQTQGLNFQFYVISEPCADLSEDLATYMNEDCPNSNYSNYPVSNSGFLDFYILNEYINCLGGSFAGGNANFPWDIDNGIRVTGLQSLGFDNTDRFESLLFAHELGHYFGLRHTFENSIFSDDECDDDGITDTDPDDSSTNPFSGNIMDYVDTLTATTLSPNAIFSPCQKAKIIDVLFECRNQFCDDRPENYLAFPEQQSISLCEDQEGLFYFTTLSDCYTWYQVVDPNTNHLDEIITFGNVFTPSFDNGPGIYRFFLKDNGFAYNPDCGLQITIEVTESSPENCSAITDIASNNELMFSDPCSCDDPQNCDISGITYFHDTLTVFTGGIAGLTISVAPGVVDFYTDVPCFSNSNSPTLAAAGTIIPEVPVGSGIYKLEFWRPAVIPSISVQSGGQTFMVPSETFEPICVCDEAISEIPTLGEWGLLCLFILLMIFGVSSIKQYYNSKLAHENQ